MVFRVQPKTCCDSMMRTRKSDHSSFFQLCYHHTLKQGISLFDRHTNHDQDRVVSQSVIFWGPDGQWRKETTRKCRHLPWYLVIL